MKSNLSIIENYKIKRTCSCPFCDDELKSGADAYLIRTSSQINGFRVHKKCLTSNKAMKIDKIQKKNKNASSKNCIPHDIVIKGYVYDKVYFLSKGFIMTDEVKGMCRTYVLPTQYNAQSSSAILSEVFEKTEGYEVYVNGTRVHSYEAFRDMVEIIKGTTTK